MTTAESTRIARKKIREYVEAYKHAVSVKAPLPLREKLRGGVISSAALAIDLGVLTPSEGSALIGEACGYTEGAKGGETLTKIGVRP